MLDSTKGYGWREGCSATNRSQARRSSLFRVWAVILLIWGGLKSGAAGKSKSFWITVLVTSLAAM